MGKNEKSCFCFRNFKILSFILNTISGVDMKNTSLFNSVLRYEALKMI